MALSNNSPREVFTCLSANCPLGWGRTNSASEGVQQYKVTKSKYPWRKDNVKSMDTCGTMARLATSSLGENCRLEQVGNTNIFRLTAPADATLGWEAIVQQGQRTKRARPEDAHNTAGKEAKGPWHLAMHIFEVVFFLCP